MSQWKTISDTRLQLSTPAPRVVLFFFFSFHPHAGTTFRCAVTSFPGRDITPLLLVCNFKSGARQDEGEPASQTRNLRDYNYRRN